MRDQNHSAARPQTMVECQHLGSRPAGTGSGLACAGLLSVFVCAGLFSIGTSQAVAQNSLLFSEDFEAGLSVRWEEQGFPSIARHNVFSLASEPDGNHYLKVESDRSSSAKGVHLTFAPRQCPHVSWRWRISNTIAAGDLMRKEGDDAAAKLYVVFRGPSFWNPLDKRILVYLWDHRAPVGAIYPNAWLPSKERMVIVESGTAKVGQWVTEQVHLANDFMRAFPGKEPGEVEAVAFLADTDNTRSRVIAGFDDLAIRCAEPETNRVRP
ncbi:DUF3047 domain-containing protein [Nitrospira defluvii]|uniref:DUF3047 domain-containing protein n=1 Tax=Nitrospira defluvii TaxID=330214 RepID=A0ABN7MG10_9BACT|nr:DUF3047 domain-containing protein [Nitrospira defluvii]CAE6796784.1 conserved hypothetical protein [Nitrospira defluvii]